MTEQIALNEGISFDEMMFETLRLAARIAKNCNGACSITFLTLYYFHKNNKIAGKSRESYLSLISLRSLIFFWYPRELIHSLVSSQDIIL